MMVVEKQHLPIKAFVPWERAFAWRKMQERVCDQVKYRMDHFPTGKSAQAPSPNRTSGALRR
jgi:hypothetical protein